MRKLTTDQFIEKAKLVHGDKYDYSKTMYTKAKFKLTVTCRNHGDFTQKANNHLNGNGCPTCANKVQMSTSEFIAKAKLVHGDKYDYTMSECKSYSHKITIKCPSHGYFKQSYENHLKKGMGCRACGSERMKKLQTKTASQFIDESKIIHGDKYDYSKVNYVGRVSKVIINCAEHGDFNQNPACHLRGSGCPSCANTCFDTSKQSKLYILVSEDGSMIKVGITNNYNRRVSELKCSTPFNFEMLDLYSVEGSVARIFEKSLHSMLNSANLKGFNGATEWFLHNGDFIDGVRLMLS
jgi:Zn finger protein HypA/HybF involved in hydrogenase expression